MRAIMTVSGKKEILRQTAAIMRRIEQLPLDVRREVLNGLYDGDFDYSESDAELYYDRLVRMNLCDTALSEYSDDSILGLVQKCITDKGPPFTTDSAMLGLCQELEALRLANAGHVRRLNEIKESLQKSWDEALAFIKEIESLIYSSDIQLSNGKGQFYSGSYMFSDEVTEASIKLFAALPQERLTEELSVLKLHAVRYKLDIESIGKKISARSGEIAAEVAFGAFDMGWRDALAIEDRLYALLVNLPASAGDQSLFHQAAEGGLGNKPVTAQCVFVQDNKSHLRQRTVCFNADDMQLDGFPRKIEDTFVAGVRRLSKIETFGGDIICRYFGADGGLLAEKPGIFARAAIAFNFSSDMAPSAVFARPGTQMTEAERVPRIKGAIKLLPPDVQRGVILRINVDYPDYAMAGFDQRHGMYMRNVACCHDAALTLLGAVRELGDARNRIGRLQETFSDIGASSVFAGISNDLDAIRAQYEDIIDKAEGQAAENEARKRAIEIAMGRIAVHMQGQNAAGLPHPETQNVIAAVSADYDSIPDEVSMRMHAYQAAAQNMQIVTAHAIEKLDRHLQEISNAVSTAQGYLQAAGDLPRESFGLDVGAPVPATPPTRPRRL